MNTKFNVYKTEQLGLFLVLLVNTFLPHSDCRHYIGYRYLYVQELILNWLHYVTVLEHRISHITCLFCYFRTDLSVYFVYLLSLLT